MLPFVGKHERFELSLFARIQFEFSVINYLYMSHVNHTITFLVCFLNCYVPNIIPDILKK